MNWIAYGLIAAACFGVNGIIYKMAQQRGNFSPYHGVFIFGLGILAVFSLVYMFNFDSNFEWKSSGLLFLSGIIWAVGMLAVAIAIYQKADLARLAPIYNINTLVTVFLGIIFLKEIPDLSSMVRVISGAVLIVVGAIMVSI